MVDEFVIRCGSTVDVAGDEWDLGGFGQLHRASGVGWDERFDGIPIHEGEVVVLGVFLKLQQLSCHSPPVVYGYLAEEGSSG